MSRASAASATTHPLALQKPHFKKEQPQKIPLDNGMCWFGQTHYVSARGYPSFPPTCQGWATAFASSEPTKSGLYWCGQNGGVQIGGWAHFKIFVSKLATGR